MRGAQSGDPAGGAEQQGHGRVLCSHHQRKALLLTRGGGTSGPGIAKTRGKTRHSLFQKQHQGKELEATERKAAAGPGSSLFTVNGARGGGPRSQLLLKSPTSASFDLLPGREAERWPQLWAPCEGSERTRGQKGGEPAGHAAAPRRDGAVGLLPAPPGGHLWGLQGRGSQGHGTSLREKEERQEGREKGREGGREESHALLGRTRLEPSAPGGPGAAVAPPPPHSISST